MADFTHFVPPNPGGEVAPLCNRPAARTRKWNTPTVNPVNLDKRRTGTQRHRLDACSETPASLPTLRSGIRLSKYAAPDARFQETWRRGAPSSWKSRMKEDASPGDDTLSSGVSSEIQYPGAYPGGTQHPGVYPGRHFACGCIQGDTLPVGVSRVQVFGMSFPDAVCPQSKSLDQILEHRSVFPSVVNTGRTFGLVPDIPPKQNNPVQFACSELLRFEQLPSCKVWPSDQNPESA